MTARSVTLTADGGQVNVLGSIVAKSSNERSSISLFGAQGVSLGAGAELHADGSGKNSRGGIVTLGTTTGVVDVAEGSTISTSGTAEKGRVQIRAPGTTDGTDVAVSRLGANFIDVAQVGIESFLSFTTPATLTQTDFNGYAQAVASYFKIAAPKIFNRLGNLNGASLVVTPGLDLAYSGSLLKVGSLELSGLRPEGQPVNVSIRATGSITTLDNSRISDGFVMNPDIESENPHPYLEMQAGNSASLRFAAGATPGSANPLAVAPVFAGVAGSANDFTLGAGSIIRTGTGDLGIAASRDLIYNTGASVYTAGKPAAKTVVVKDGRVFGFATAGGQLSLIAGRNLVGSPVQQAVGIWQERAGSPATPESPEAVETQWGIDFEDFGWNAGSFGGGDVNVRAGGNVLNASIAAANSGKQQSNGSITEYGGGVLSIEAGGDISSLHANVTHGTNGIRAASALGRVRPPSSSSETLKLGSVFAIQDAAVDIRARSGIALESAYNPTAINQPSVAGNDKSFFYTYGNQSHIDAVSAAGDVSLQVESTGTRLATFIGASEFGTSNARATLPPSVRLNALGGDVLLRGTGTLFGSDSGQLDLLAARDILGSGGSLFMSDLPAGASPSPLAPASGLPPTGNIAGGQKGSGRHLNDTVAAEITAGRDIRDQIFSLAKMAHVRAGRDILDTSILGQNLRPTDVTLISAGRDIRYTTEIGEIQLGGPGSLVVLAARDVDLGFSEGITSIGATLNPALPTDSGADISVIAGYGPGLRVERFLAGLVDKSQDYRNALVAFIARLSPNELAPSYESARSQFLLMDTSRQLGFISQVFFSELVKSGREVNQDPKLGFDRGYAAIDALFPGSRPGQSDPANPYDGDILLAFSRIYSLSDGTISLFAPGGLLNVGLANPPEHLPVARPPSQLGIVAQRAGDVRVFTEGDVLVNASRIFTLGGGNIAVWSTLGNIDAGRGAKSAISAPPPIITTDDKGNVTVDLGAAVAGSGIRTIITRKDVSPGDVDLIAPAGIVNAGDAGIGSAGNLNVAAQQVVGLDNIQVGGSSSGVPAETSNLGASLSGASSASTSASSSSSAAVEERGGSQGPAPLADTALGWLEVFVEGFGEEVCKPADQQCMERSRKPQ